jgi:hypothetical protein
MSRAVRVPAVDSRIIITPRPIFSALFTGVYLHRIYTPYLCITNSPSGLRYRRLGCTCLDTDIRPICLDTYALHDVIAWYCLTVFSRPTPRVRHQVNGTHSFRLT